MWSGIPLTAARNQLLDVINAFSMSSFPQRVGCDAFHTSITYFCISVILFHLSFITMLFPIHEPRVLMGSPSFISWTCSGSLLVLSPRILPVITLFLCLGVPIGSASVFSILKHAVDALQNRFIISSRSLNLSFFPR